MSNETLLHLPTMDPYGNPLTANSEPARSPLRDLPNTAPAPRQVLDAVGEHLGQPTAAPEPMHNETPLPLPTMEGHATPAAAQPRTVGDLLNTPPAGHVTTNTGESALPLPSCDAYSN